MNKQIEIDLLTQLKRRLINECKPENYILEQNVTYPELLYIWTENNKTIANAIEKILDYNKEKGYLVQEITVKVKTGISLNRLIIKQHKKKITNWRKL